MDINKLAEHLYHNMLTPAQLEQIKNGTPVVITAPDGKSAFQFTRNNEGNISWTQSEIVEKPKATAEELAKEEAAKKLTTSNNAAGKVSATNTSNWFEKDLEEQYGNKAEPKVVQPIDTSYKATGTFVKNPETNYTVEATKEQLYPQNVKANPAAHNTMTDEEKKQRGIPTDADTAAQKQKALAEQASKAIVDRNNADRDDFAAVYGDTYKPTNYYYSNDTYNKAGEILGDTAELNQLRGTLAKNPHTQYKQNPAASIGIATDETYNDTNTKQILANLKEIKESKDVYALDTVNAYRSQVLNYLASVDKEALDACIQNGQYKISAIQASFGGRNFWLSTPGVLKGVFAGTKTKYTTNAVDVLEAADDTRKVLIKEQNKLVTDVNPTQLEKAGTYTQNETELDYQRGITDGTAIAQYNMAKLQMTAQARELSGILYEYAQANKDRYPAINDKLKALNAEITTRLNNINGYNTAINQALAKVDSRAGIAPDYVKAVYFTIASQALRDYTLLPEARQFYEEMLANNQVNSPTVAAAGTTADIAGKAYKGVK